MKTVQTLWELFLAGGFLMWPIVAMSVVVVAFGIERAWALRRSRFVPRPLTTALASLSSDGPFDPRRVYRTCAAHPSVLADVIKAMLEKIGRPLPEIEHAVEAAKEREASRLYANIRPISLAVSVTPLLGLLGTVQGMILAFYTTANLEAGAPGHRARPGDLRRPDHHVCGPLRGDPGLNPRPFPRRSNSCGVSSR